MEQRHCAPHEAWAVCMKVLFQKLAAYRAKAQEGLPLASRILMFHDVCPDGETPAGEYACTLSALQNSVRYHEAKGFTFVSMDALLAMPEAEALTGKCVLTFDDGHARLASVAVPWLLEAGVPFTLYICTDLINETGYLTGSDLQRLSQSPLCTIGSHGVTHGMTRFLSRSAVQYELTHSRLVLDSLLGGSAVHFAFPYGSAYACSHRDIVLARKCGYHTAALTMPTALTSLHGGALYRLPRLNMPHTHG